MAPKLEFSFSFARPDTQSESSRSDDSPLKILILGDFSGSGAASDVKTRPTLPHRTPARIDLDRFDDVMAKLAPRVTLGSGSAAEVIDFREVDDFRPEQLGKKLKMLRQLEQFRQELRNPATFTQATEKLKQQFSADVSIPESTPEAAAPSPTAPAENDADTLQRLLGARPAGSGSASTPPAVALQSGMQQFIAKMIEPHVKRDADPHLDVYLGVVDKARGDLVRAILSNPSFQTLEATWRSVRRLVESIEDDDAVQIFLLDVTRDELQAGLPTEDQQLTEWNLYRRLSNDSGQGSDPWSLIVADFQFAAREEDLALLGALTVTAERLQIPILSGADGSLHGCKSLVETPDPTDWKPLDAQIAKYWQALRQSPAAKWVGLTLPRVLLRLPYGKATDEVETFAFEEFTTVRVHESYLWGNPAYLCAELIAQSFAEDGWSLELGSQCDIGSLPAHTYSDDGESKLQPCAEVALSQRAADLMLKSGLMPLMSWKDRDAVRLLRFQSIAEPLSPLAGPWS